MLYSRISMLATSCSSATSSGSLTRLAQLKIVASSAAERSEHVSRSARSTWSASTAMEMWLQPNRRNTRNLLQFWGGLPADATTVRGECSRGTGGSGGTCQRAAAYSFRVKKRGAARGAAL